MQLFCKNSFRYLSGAFLIFFAACTSLPSAVPETQATLPVTQPALPDPPAAITAPAPTATPEPQSMLAVSAEDLRGVMLQFWHSWSGDAGGVISALVDDFNLHNSWGILVSPVQKVSIDDLHGKVLAAKERGEVADVLVGMHTQALVWDQEIGLVDLNEYAGDPIWGFKAEEIADFYPVFWQADLVNEKRLGIPAQRSGQLIFYNRTWAGELGFPALPRSAEDFAAQACAAAKTSPTAGAGGWAISTDYPSVLSWLYAFGAQVYTANAGSSELDAYKFAQPEVEQAFLFLRRLYDDGCAWLPENTWSEDAFATRSALFASGSMLDIPHFRQAMLQTGNRDQWTVLAYAGAEDVFALDVYGPSFQVVGSNPQRELAAWLFIKWMLEPQNQARLVEATSAFPLRKSTLEHLGGYAGRSPQWAEAVKLLEYGKMEPRLSSWATVRWALSDAATQLFRAYTTIEQVPDLVKFLDRTAEDLHP